MAVSPLWQFAKDDCGLARISGMGSGAIESPNGDGETRVIELHDL